MAWQSDYFSQDDSINNGYPYLNDAEMLYFTSSGVYSVWTISNDYPKLSTTELKRFDGSGAYSIWQFDKKYNDGYPYHVLVYDTPKEPRKEITTPQVDWTKSMTQTFEYYVVNPDTWKDESKLDTVTSSSISRDSDSDTLGSATIDIMESVGECYIRIYLVAIQNGVTFKYPLGTFLVQTPSSTFNGKVLNVSMDAYTPLIELKENKPPLGYYIPKEKNVMKYVSNLTAENLRAPVVSTSNDTTLYSNFVAETDETWIEFISSLMSNAKYTFDIDELGRILFTPNQEISAMQPVWTYTDDNSSILYPEISMDHDLYGIPNVVEVIHSSAAGNFYARVVNDDENSPTSTVSRGREIVYRVTDPDLIGDPTAKQIDMYAEKLLKEVSSIEYTVSYTHGYCPVRVGDCVMLNYEKAGIKNVKAKVISQTIKCTPGTPVTEKAVFTTKLWR